VRTFLAIAIGASLVAAGALVGLSMRQPVVPAVSAPDSSTELAALSSGRFDASSDSSHQRAPEPPPSAWTVSHNRDRVTDREGATALTFSIDSDGTRGYLAVVCLYNRDLKVVYDPGISTVGNEYRDVAVRRRLNEGAPTPMSFWTKIADVDMNTLYAPVEEQQELISDFRRGRTILLAVTDPTTRRSAWHVFSLAGFSAAARELPCLTK